MISASYVPIIAISCIFQRGFSKQKQIWRIEMNVTTSEEPYEILAKTCGCKERNRKVTLGLSTVPMIIYYEVINIKAI